MTSRTARYVARLRLRMLVKAANAVGWPVVYAVKEIEA